MDGSNKQTPAGIDFEHIFDISPDLIFILDTEHNIIRANKAMNNCLGVSSGALAGSKCFWNMHQTDEPPACCVHEQMLKDGKVHTIELFLEPLDGWFSVTVTPLLDKKGNITGSIHIAHDITERKKTVASLQESEKRFQLLFNNAPLGYQSLDFDGNFIEVTQTWLDTLGYSRHEVIGKWFGDFLSPAYQEGFRKRFPIFKANGQIHSEFEMVHKNGSKLFIAFEGKIGYDSNGTFKQTHCILKDITEYNKAEEALKNSLSLMDAMLESIHNGILVVSEQGSIIKTNTKFAELWNIPGDILKSADDKVLLNYVVGQLNDPDEFMAKVSELYNKPESESYDFIYFRDGRIFERISKPMYLGNRPKGRVWSFHDITDRKKSEVALRESEERYRTLIENMGEGVGFVNEEEVFVFANPSAERIFGVGKGELTGLCLTDFLAGESLETVIKETQKRHKGESSTYEHEIVLKDGSIKYILGTATPSFKDDKFIGTFAIFRDISDRKQAEVALRESEATHRNLVERMPDGVYRSTYDGKFVDVNPAMIKMLGYDSKEELMAIDIKTQLYFEPADRESLVLQEKLEEMGVYSLKKKDGSAIWVEDHGWYMMGENEEILVHEGILRDITDRKQAEEEIKRKNEELLKLNNEKDKFFSIIAHDLRSPFQPLLGFTRMLVEDLPTLRLDEIQKMALNMRGAANKLFNLLENLLQWSRMQRGLTTFEPESFLILPKLSDCLAPTLEAITHKKIDLTYDVPDDLAVFADGNMFESIIRNILSNAIKFTDYGGKIIIRAKIMDGNWVEIAVNDTGIGMNKEILENLFKLDANTNRKGLDGEPSSGLGLIICKDFIEKHGGKLWVESEVNRGSTFYFTLPNKARK
jgi:PAS domain S-box-containing protein